jgi:hypothetical protein
VGAACWHAWRSGALRPWRIRAEGRVAFVAAASGAMMADGLAIVLAQPRKGLMAIVAVVVVAPVFWRAMNAEEDAVLAARRFR